jgi:hypothetical protein
LCFSPRDKNNWVIKPFHFSPTFSVPDKIVNFWPFYFIIIIFLLASMANKINFYIMRLRPQVPTSIWTVDLIRKLSHIAAKCCKRVQRILQVIKSLFVLFAFRKEMISDLAFLQQRKKIEAIMIIFDLQGYATNWSNGDLRFFRRWKTFFYIIVTTVN